VIHVVTRGTDIRGSVFQPVLGAQIIIGARPFAAIPCGPHHFLLEPQSFDSILRGTENGERSG
jgi:hypothetical protein